MAWLARWVVAVAVAIVALTGCSTTEVAEAEEDMTPRFSYEVVTDDTWMYTDVVTDTETGCQYLLVGDDDGYGLTLLVDKYGNPLLAQGYSRSEVGMSDDDGE